MKTPVQELFEYMEQNQYFIGNDLLAKYKELLEKEKDVRKTELCSFTTGYLNNCVEINHNEIELTKEVEEYYDWLLETAIKRH